MDSAVILAGGESSRFGRPKALIAVDGRPMVRRVADGLGPLVRETVVSVAGPSMAEAVKTILPGVTVAVDRRRAVGPIEGIIRGFEAAHGNRVVVAPCDAPLLRPDLYRLLLEAMGDHEAAVPKFDVFDPVRAVYRRAAVLRVVGHQAEGLPSPSALVDCLDAVFVDENTLRSADPRLDSFLDVNTHGDLDEVLRRIRSPSE